MDPSCTTGRVRLQKKSIKSLFYPKEIQEHHLFLTLDKESVLVQATLDRYLRCTAVQVGKCSQKSRLNPLDPKIKMRILLCCLYSFPAEVVGRS